MKRQDMRYETKETSNSEKFYITTSDIRNKTNVPKWTIF